jgi:hypothetical protein
MGNFIRNPIMVTNRAFGDKPTFESLEVNLDIIIFINAYIKSRLFLIHQIIDTPKCLQIGRHGLKFEFEVPL